MPSGAGNLSRFSAHGPGSVGWDHFSHEECSLNTVVLGDRNVFARNKLVPVEPENRFLVPFFHMIVVKRPALAAVVHEPAVFVILAMPEAMHPASLALVLPDIAVEMSVFGERCYELIAVCPAALRELRVACKLEPNLHQRQEILRSWQFLRMPPTRGTTTIQAMVSDLVRNAAAEQPFGWTR